MQRTILPFCEGAPELAYVIKNRSKRIAQEIAAIFSFTQMETIRSLIKTVVTDYVFFYCWIVSDMLNFDGNLNLLGAANNTLSEWASPYKNQPILRQFIFVGIHIKLLT